MGAGLDCCVRRQKDDDQESATDVLENRCAPRQAPNETLEAAGVLTPNASDSVRKIDNMGASPIIKRDVNSERSRLEAQVAQLQAQLSRKPHSIDEYAEESKEQKPADNLDLQRMQETLREVAATMGEESEAYKQYKDEFEKKRTAQLSSKVETPRFFSVPAQTYPPTAKIPASPEKETSISEVSNEASELEPMLSLTAPSFSVKNEASEKVERMLSLLAQSSSVIEASEDVPPVQALQSHDPAEEWDIMPSPNQRQAPSVLYHSVSEWFNAPEDRFADEGKPAGNEVAGTKSLAGWYSDSCTLQDLSTERPADSEGEAGREPETGAALFYSMSQSFKPTDLVSRPTLDKLGSFVMSQPAPSLSVKHGTTSNVPHVD